MVYPIPQGDHNNLQLSLGSTMQT